MARVFLASLIIGAVVAGFFAHLAHKPADGESKKAAADAAPSEATPAPAQAASTSPSSGQDQAAVSPPANPGSSTTANPADRPGRIYVVFKNAVPSGFQNGHASTCTLVTDVRNRSKYHLSKLTFKIDDWRFELKEEMNANTYINDYEIAEITLEDGGGCFAEAEYLSNSIDKAAVFDCSIPGVAEGDCQDLVSIVTTIDQAKIASIKSSETSAGQRQTAPLRDAIAKAGLGTGSNAAVAATPDRLKQLLDTVVALDSSSWSWNKYQPGSMTNASIVTQTPDGRITVKGYYSYREGGDRTATGWVEATIQKGQLNCLRYHDFADQCRAIRLPDVAVN